MKSWGVGQGVTQGPPQTGNTNLSNMLQYRIKGKPAAWDLGTNQKKMTTLKWPRLSGSCWPGTWPQCGLASSLGLCMRGAGRVQAFVAICFLTTRSLLSIEGSSGREMPNTVTIGAASRSWQHINVETSR